MFEKFMEIYNIEEDEVFNINGYRYRIHNDWLEIKGDEWGRVRADFMLSLVTEVILGEREVTKFPWKPKIGDIYYKVVDKKDSLATIWITWDNTCDNISDYIAGNCFKTIEEINVEEVYQKLLDNYNNM